ncbi:MAG: hypothetical protein CR982_02520 [Candidatus Cloacimonadota bacterium]|nr:MAG: hypothetical protein CR982_02520 [Candidatus Cloacimonadota bacterium]PIE78523.1 MAG: hypothetical protein CSA15_07460 [Candidatus Delongbacteria bacterium]
MKLLIPLLLLTLLSLQAQFTGGSTSKEESYVAIVTESLFDKYYSRVYLALPLGGFSEDFNIENINQSKREIEIEGGGKVGYSFDFGKLYNWNLNIDKKFNIFTDFTILSAQYSPVEAENGDINEEGSIMNFESRIGIGLGYKVGKNQHLFSSIQIAPIAWGFMKWEKSFDEDKLVGMDYIKPSIFFGFLTDRFNISLQIRFSEMSYKWDYDEGDIDIVTPISTYNLGLGYNF